MRVQPSDLDGVAALAAAETTWLRKIKGERDTEFVKRIVCAYLNAERELADRTALSRTSEAARLDAIKRNPAPF